MLLCSMARSPVEASQLNFSHIALVMVLACILIGGNFLPEAPFFSDTHARTIYIYAQHFLCNTHGVM